MSLEFREWLLLRLRNTAYAQQGYGKGESLEEVAVRIGVQPDLLREAQAEVMLERKAQGHMLLRRNARQIDLFMPPVVFEAWKAECESRGVEGSTLLRSSIHHYLLGTWEPQDLIPYWRFQGKRYRCGRHKSAFPRERAEITTGAWRALCRRGDQMGASAAMVIRGIVHDILGGGFRTIALVPTGNLYDDEERYVLTSGAAVRPRHALDRHPAKRPNPGTR